jgi:hypothetical protein
MQKFKLVLLLSLALPLSGCAWWQNFKTDPVVQVQSFESSVQTALDVAGIVWLEVRATVPAASLAKAEALYDAAALAVHNAVGLLGDAVQAAVVAQSANPDFSAAIQAVSDAVSRVLAVIDQFKAAAAVTTAPGVTMMAPEPQGYTYLQHAVATVQRRAKGR